MIMTRIYWLSRNCVYISWARKTASAKIMYPLLQWNETEIKNIEYNLKDLHLSVIIWGKTQLGYV